MDANGAREIVDTNSYLTLATADADGVPWASPVWFAHEDYTAFFWMSRPTARHSRNIDDRADIGIVIFDSSVSPRGRNAVYVEAVAEQVPDADLDRVVAIYSARSVARGLEPLLVHEVAGVASFRLYRADASAQSSKTNTTSAYESRFRHAARHTFDVRTKPGAEGTAPSTFAAHARYMTA